MAHRMDRTLVRAFPYLVLSLALAAGCKHQQPAVDFNSALPPGAVALRKIPPSQYPDFSHCTWNLNLLPQSVAASIDYMTHGSSRQFFPYLDISHDRALATLYAFQEVLTNAAGQGAPGTYIDQQIRSRFEVYKSIGAPKPEGGGYTDRVLFTGYFTPIYDASLTRTAEFAWPIYKRPQDLVADPMGKTLGRRTPDGQVVPYWTRKQIESENKLAGQEMLYLRTRWEAYVVTVQGSARLRMRDGKLLEIGFAGQNGYEYTSPGKRMVADNAIDIRDLNFRALSAYFAAHPDAMDKYLWLNERTVFFTERPGGPFGALNVPITTFASIATDKNEWPNAYPRSMPAFLDVPIPTSTNPSQNWRFRGFMMDQDSGGAIRASGRCDIFMGIGDQGEQLAGHQLSEGELYYIALKPEQVPPIPERQANAGDKAGGVRTELHCSEFGL